MHKNDSTHTETRRNPSVIRQSTCRYMIDMARTLSLSPPYCRYTIGTICYTDRAISLSACASVCFCRNKPRNDALITPQYAQPYVCRHLAYSCSTPVRKIPPYIARSQTARDVRSNLRVLGETACVIDRRLYAERRLSVHVI